MKAAFLFPGQGAQFVGMGRDIVEQSDDARRLFERADRLLGFELSRICFHGPAERLNSTDVSQPAIFLVSAAMLELLKARTGLSAEVTAGLSLGEYTALYAAGAIVFDDALALCAKRGRAMQQAADRHPGAMVSIIGMDEAGVRRLCDLARQGQLLEPVNFNCPGQIVVSGSIGACERAERLARECGAMKAVRLDVAGAFHTEMMTEAAEALEKALAGTSISPGDQVRTIANTTAEYYTEPSQVAAGLVSQLTGAILWQKCMERLIRDGIEKFYEIGPGRVLTGLMKRIDRKAKIHNIGTIEALEALVVD